MALACLLLAGAGAWLWFKNVGLEKEPGRERLIPVSEPGPQHPDLEGKPGPSTNASPATAPPEPATLPLARPIEPAPAPPAQPLAAKSLTPRELQLFPRPAADVLEAQVALTRQGISCGSIDGVMGPQTRAALAVFQREQGLKDSGELNDFTRELLVLDRQPLTNHEVIAGELSRIRPLSRTWLGKSQQASLDYENLVELIAETYRCSPRLIQRLNPNINWLEAGPGTTVVVPDTSPREFRKDAAFIRISLNQRSLSVYDAATNIIAFFPCSIARKVEKRPAGELHVSAIAPDPNYTFNPDIFAESPEAQQLGRKLIIPPGPNNPVGAAWISLSLPGYGIHGTPEPEQVGRTESHGCFRLANWNATHLANIVKIGMPVYVE